MMTMLTHLAFRPPLAALTTQAARLVELATLGSKVIHSASVYPTITGILASVLRRWLSEFPPLLATCNVCDVVLCRSCPAPRRVMLGQSGPFRCRRQTTSQTLPFGSTMMERSGILVYDGARQNDLRRWSSRAEQAVPRRHKTATKAATQATFAMGSDCLLRLYSSMTCL